MAVMTTKVSNRDVRSDAQAPDVGNVMDRVSDILGYDLAETQAIESDSELYQRVIARLGTGETVPASDVFGTTAE